MSDDRFKKSKRISKTINAIERQRRIAKSLGINHGHNQPHRYSKHHATNCGIPKCPMCGNPRKVWKDLTLQEKKLLEKLKLDNKDS